MQAKLPVSCPSCSSPLLVSKLDCTNCETSISGQFALPLLLQLSQDEQNFALQFLIFSGSLKEMATQMGNSYPTVRNKLDDLITKLKTLQNQ
jgi:hypothetical protein